MSSYFTNKITFLNVLLTFCIVLLHAKTPERYGLDLDWNYPFIYSVTILCNAAVPLFYFISGLLFYKTCLSFQDVTRKIKSRIYSLLIPYLLWNTIFVTIFFILVRIPIIHQTMNMGKILGTPVDFLYAILGSYHTDLWFVKNLIVYTLLSPIVFYIVRNKKTRLISLLVLAFLYVFYDWEYTHLMNWLLIYYIGALFGYNYNSIYPKILESFRDRTIFVISIPLLFIVLYIISLLDVDMIKYYRLCSPMLIFCIVDIWLYDYLNNSFVKKRWMSYMFFIYCTHHFVLNVLQKIIVISLPHTGVVMHLSYIVTPVLTVLLLIGFSNKTSHFKIYKMLNGGR